MQKRMLQAQELELQEVINHPKGMLEMGPVQEQQELLSDKPSWQFIYELLYMSEFIITVQLCVHSVPNILKNVKRT